MDDQKKLDILISLHRGYGLGDAVMMSSVLRHVRKYRPNWRFDFQAEEGRYQIGRGIADNTFAYGQPYPRESYDGEVLITLYDTWANWHDRPNTRVSSCLHEHFGLAWDAECGRYQINVSEEAYGQVIDMVPRRAVAFHYEGDTAKVAKDLDYETADAIRSSILGFRRRPLLLDWRNSQLLRHHPTVATVGNQPKSVEWGRSAEMNCAVISQCEAFIGIDSGPSKCASATEVPALVIWTGHHPAGYHDPAPNTTHLVPLWYEGLHPVISDPEVLKFFRANYRVRWYDRAEGPVGEVRKWLEETLK